MKRRLALSLGLALVAACDISQSCDQEFEPARGNLDRLSDIVLVTPPGQDDPPHTFALLANPELEQLRVFDTFTANFVRAPNLFFPLAVRTGPATHRLAAAPERPDRAFALDGANDEILVVRTVDEDAGEAFTEVTRLPTGRAPSDLAVRVVDGAVELFVALPDAGAVEILDEDGANLATVALPAGSRPARLALDPTGDALVVTDGVLDQVHLIAADERALDRSLDVGGPTLGVAAGVVDVGDGLAPVALALRQDAPEVAVLRLFRPGYREDRYALLSRVALPKPGSAAYVPDQREAEVAARVCCEGIPAEDATLAWAGVLTSDGDMHYLRLDAERGRERTGERTLEPRPLGEPLARRAGARLFAAPVVLESAFDGLGTPIDEGALCLEPVDNLGDPPRVPLTDEVVLTFEFEGVPALARNRRGLAEGGELRVTGRALEDSDVRVNDEVEIELPAGVGASCPETLSLPLESFSGATFALAGLDDGDLACLEQADDFRVSFRAADAWIVTADGAYLARLDTDATGDEASALPAACSESPTDEAVQFDNNDLMFEAPGVLAGFRAPVGALRGDTLTVSYGSPELPVVLELGNESSVFGGGGFSERSTLVGGVAGGIFQVTDGNGGGVAVRRAFVATGAGSGLLLELAEAESNVDNVISHQ